MHFYSRAYGLLVTATCCLVASTAMAQNNLSIRLTERPEVVQSCEGCHGAGGNSEVTTTPRLNGQQEEYMVARLKAFTKESQNNPHLKLGMFKDLSSQRNEARVSVASYFSSHPATNPKIGNRAAEGRRIFENGLTSENIIACTQCHGPKGEGHNAVPRLAGQHADYLMAQLQLFNLKFRKHVLMGSNTVTMSKNTMEVLAAYLASN